MRRPKVLIVNPSNNPVSELHPVGLLSIATYLESKGCNVKLMDGACGHNHMLYATNFNPDVVAIGGMTPHIMNSYRLAQIFKSLCNSYTVIGGVHATATPAESIQFSDAVVTGEGEQTLLKLVKSKEKGIFKGDPIRNLDSIPRSNFNLIEFERYANVRKCQHNSIWSFVLPWDRVMAMISSRGCPFKCIYCHSTYTKIPIRFRSIDSIIDEMKYLKRRRIQAVHFIDDTIMLSKKRMFNLCARLAEEKLGIYFSVSARAPDITDEVLDALTSAGCSQIAFGFESASQRILDILRKQIKVEDSKNAIDLCNKHGIVAQGSFMFGNPTETLEEMNTTYNFIKDNYMDGGIGTFITTPYPGTTLWKWCMEQGHIPDKINWESLSFNRTWIPMHEVSQDIFSQFMNKVLTLANNLFVNRELSRFSKSKKIKRNITK